jgi:hypothetical protein
VDTWVQAQDPAIMRQKRPFSVGELNLIFQHPWFTGCESENQMGTSIYRSNLTAES